jgi:hypothetical protein
MRLFFDKDGQKWQRYPVGLPAGVVYKNFVMPMPVVVMLLGGRTEPAWCLDGELIGRGKREPDPILWRPYRPEDIMEIMTTLKVDGVV